MQNSWILVKIRSTDSIHSTHWAHWEDYVVENALYFNWISQTVREIWIWKASSETQGCWSTAWPTFFPGGEYSLLVVAKTRWLSGCHWVAHTWLARDRSVSERASVIERSERANETEIEKGEKLDFASIDDNSGIGSPIGMNRTAF